MSDSKSDEILSCELEKTPGDPSEDLGWEAVVLKRVRGRVQEITRHLGDLVHGDAIGWESRSVEFLTEKLGLTATPELYREPIRIDSKRDQAGQ